MTKNKVKVFYDGACYLCTLEINTYRKKDKHQRIHFVDISRTEFNAAKEGLDPREVKRLFHVKDVDGEIVSGVDAFIIIWQNIDSFNFLARLARFKLIKIAMEAGYVIFVKVRPFLPKRKCETDACNI